MHENDIARQQLIRTYKLQQVATAKQTAANAIEAATQQGLRAGFNTLTVAVQQYSAAQMTAAAGGNTLRVVWAGLQVGAFALTGAVRVLGAALMAALGWISLLASVAFMVYGVLKDKLFPVSEIKQKSDEIRDSIVW